MNSPAKKDQKHDKDHDGDDLDIATGDAKVWADIADKAQDELDKGGKVSKAEDDELRKHAGG